MKKVSDVVKATLAILALDSEFPFPVDFTDEFGADMSEFDGELDEIDGEEFDDEPDFDLDESMDGDFDSAMTSAGHGTDEDYGYYGSDE